jgi:hypothetical protein
MKLQISKIEISGEYLFKDSNMYRVIVLHSEIIYPPINLNKLVIYTR